MKNIDVLTVLLPENGIMAIRKDAVTTVKASFYGGRNLACEINGTKTTAAFDTVIKSLGWSKEKLK